MEEGADGRGRIQKWHGLTWRLVPHTYGIMEMSKNTNITLYENEKSYVNVWFDFRKK